MNMKTGLKMDCCTTSFINFFRPYTEYKQSNNDVKWKEVLNFLRVNELLKKEMNIMYINTGNSKA